MLIPLGSALHIQVVCIKAINHTVWSVTVGHRQQTLRSHHGVIGPSCFLNIDKSNSLQKGDTIQLSASLKL